MAVDVDRAKATKLLNESYMRCSGNPRYNAPISDEIDLVMAGRNCLTYRYIMFTALVAKASNEWIDILSLQASDESTGAYDARTLASKVVYPFQKSMLGNILDGSNNDPLVNKPARFQRLRKSNQVAGGDPKRALFALCDALPKIRTSADAQLCVDYIVTKLLDAKKQRETEESAFQQAATNMSVFKVRRFMSELLDQGFGGAALVIVTSALYKLRFSDNSYVVRVHPVNQSGASSRQFSDLDLLRDGKPFMGTELKDKPFSASDVSHAAATARAAGASSLLFVAGRQSSFASQPPTYFKDARKRYEKLGMYVGVTSIDDLMDATLSAHVDLDAGETMKVISDTAERIGAIEAQIWVYKRLSEQ